MILTSKETVKLLLNIRFILYLPIKFNYYKNKMCKLLCYRFKHKTNKQDSIFHILYPRQSNCPYFYVLMMKNKKQCL